MDEPAHAIPEGTCRWCDMPIAFRRAQGDEWDWVAKVGKPWCTASSNCHHHPVNPVVGKHAG